MPCHAMSYLPLRDPTVRLLVSGFLHTAISRHRLQRGAEAGADGFVKGSVFGEVLLGAYFGEPEVEDVDLILLRPQTI